MSITDRMGRYEAIEEWFHRRITSIRFFYQRLTRGWDDSACWSLDDHLAPIILPRLKRFKELNVHAWPGPENGVDTFEEWQEILDKMIFAFEWDCDEDRKYGRWDNEEYERVKEGHMLFGKFFQCLWD